MQAHHAWSAYTTTFWAPTGTAKKAARKKKQNPKDLPHIVEPDGRDGLADEDDPSEDDPDDEPSAGALTPPRAPP